MSPNLTVAELLAFLVLVATVVLSVSALLYALFHWIETRRHVPAAGAWLAVGGAAAAAVMVLYRPGTPRIFWVAVGMQMLVMAGIGGTIWPAAVHWTRQGGHVPAGALATGRWWVTILGAIVTAGPPC